MNRCLVGLLIILVCGWVTCGCSKKQQGGDVEAVSQGMEASSPAGAADSADLAAPATPADSPPSAPAGGNPVAASVNGKEISRLELDRATAVLFSQYRDRIPPESMEQAKTSLRSQALENLISKNLLMADADRRGIQVDQEAVDKDFKKITDRFPSPEEFRKALAAMSVSEEDLRSEVRDNLKVEKLLEKDLAGAQQPKPEEVETFYREHAQNFQMPERVSASHILLSTRPDDPAETRAEKRQKLSTLREQIKQGADFAQLARENSDCPSKSQGGDLGQFERGRMVKAFEDVAFELKPGELSDIVETEFGYHLIKVNEHQQPGTIPLEQARADIGSFLEQQSKQKTVEVYLQKLRDAAKIEYAADLNPAPAPTTLPATP